MRILSGTGTCSRAPARTSTRARSRASGARAGHDVVVFCQEPHPERFDLGGAEVVRPELPDGLLPVFVLDRYEGLEARLLQDLTTIAARALRRRERARRSRAACPADLVFANHVLPGRRGRRPRRARASPSRRTAPSSSTRSAATSELVARGAGGARARATAVFVGSAHIRGGARGGRRPRRPRARGAARRRRRRVPPEAPGRGARAACSTSAAATRRTPGTANERLPDEGNAAPARALLRGGELPTVLYFGKLLYNKGVHLLVEALHGIDARGVIVGFGDYRQRLEELAPRHTLFTGPLEHRHLVHLIPLADVVVVPSIFPEAFGMVAAEAAAAGVPAARRTALGPRRGRRRARGRLSRAPPRRWRRSRAATRSSSPRSSTTLLALPRPSGRSSAPRPGGSRSSAGAGRASPTAARTVLSSLSFHG